MSGVSGIRKSAEGRGGSSGVDGQGGLRGGRKWEEGGTLTFHFAKGRR